MPQLERKNPDNLQSNGNYVFRKQSTSIFPDITSPKQTVRDDRETVCDSKGKCSSGSSTSGQGEVGRQHITGCAKQNIVKAQSLAKSMTK